MASEKIKNYVVYKGHPLVLCNDNVMAYGDLSKKAFADMVPIAVDVAGPIMVTIKSTAEGNAVLRANEFKNGMFEALEYAFEQIERFNKK